MIQPPKTTLPPDVTRLCADIAAAADGLEPLALMEVCGTHTHAVRRFGVRQLLPENVKLLSGPGCPVCVTAEKDVAAALSLAKRPGVALCCFGDMLRVPAGGESLLALKGRGADVRVCVSPMDVFSTAKREPQTTFVWFGVGFETTAPNTAALAEAALADGVENLFILSAHKTMPNALKTLLSEEAGVSALLCPGHVAAVTGAEAFRFLPEELGLPAAISGFEPEEILLAILALVKMLRSGKASLFNAYPRVVRPEGNRAALTLLERVFEPCAANWRGLGEILDSGLRMKREYAALDANIRWDLSGIECAENPACRCGDVLRGRIEPTQCACFGHACTPQNPLGACMVSSEGTCAAYYQYER